MNIRTSIENNKTFWVFGIVTAIIILFILLIVTQQNTQKSIADQTKTITVVPTTIIKKSTSKFFSQVDVPDNYSFVEDNTTYGAGTDKVYKLNIASPDNNLKIEFVVTPTSPTNYKNTGIATYSVPDYTFLSTMVKLNKLDNAEIYRTDANALFYKVQKDNYGVTDPTVLQFISYALPIYTKTTFTTDPFRSEFSTTKNYNITITGSIAYGVSKTDYDNYIKTFDSIIKSLSI